MDTRVLIVGGGLAGLSLADRLCQAGVDFMLVEAQDRLGGRILTETIQQGAFDLGPAWFWAGQPRMAALIIRLGLGYFEQYSSGAIMFQDQSGAVHRNRGFASMRGSYRIAGGMGALIDGLREALPRSRIQLGFQVNALAHKRGWVEAQINNGERSQTIKTERVVLAIPPRVVAETIQFSPALPDAAISKMQQTPTWMAGQAKILAVYDKPYWREAGLSGEGMSLKGPLVEIHDASAAEGASYALFGFVGFPAAPMRGQHPQVIRDLAKEQLVAMFSNSMENPIDIRLQDWAQNRFIATRRDHTSPQFHPAYGMPKELSDLWSGNLLMGSTEMGSMFGGFLEGALEAAEATEAQITKNETNRSVFNTALGIDKLT